eukprot:GHVU01119104.1.p1 GENE.GHVU01119104.1~~GHVU01119104.1.p1  ORF type:complete len:116 (+),score=3.53 GHVU01119104.1:351-698(+)
MSSQAAHHRSLQPHLVQATHDRGGSRTGETALAHGDAHACMHVSVIGMPPAPPPMRVGPPLIQIRLSNNVVNNTFTLLERTREGQRRHLSLRTATPAALSLLTDRPTATPARHTS